MLYLRTGLPGSGKTLNTIREIELDYGQPPAPTGLQRWMIKMGWAKAPEPRELRTVYYYGIPDLDVSKLTCKWVEWNDPDNWFKLPDGSVIVMDEAQRVFGAQDVRKARPEKVARFETHRHQGFDIFLITQHPSLLMTHVRKLVGKHVHMYRPYGGKTLHRHEYEFCIDAPEKRSNFKMAQVTRVKLDPKYYGLYKSATVHTHKFKLPTYVKLIPLLLLLIGACVATAGYFIQTDQSEAAAAPTAAAKPAQAGKVVDSSPNILDPLGSARQAFVQGGPLTTEQYVHNIQPRLDELPKSAPRYDNLDQPKTIPRLVCASSHDQRLIEKNRKYGQVGKYQDQEVTCQCYTQQMSKVATSVAFCMDIVENGYFDDSRPDPIGVPPAVAYQPTGQASAGVPAPQMFGAVTATADPGMTRVTVIPDTSRTEKPWSN